MSEDIRYNPNGFTPIESMVTHVPERAAETETTHEQIVWQQLETDRWVEVTLIRYEGDVPRVAIKRAVEHIGRTPRGWNQTREFPASRLNLVEDANTQPSSAPAYHAPQNAATAYAAKKRPANLRKDQTK